ncbi:hypothetical protein BHE74_00048080, partial [Ensete ventricosum]
LGIGLGSDDAVGPRREFARRFAEGIWKLAGNTLGDRWKKTIELTVRMPEAIELSGRQLSVDELPRSGSLLDQVLRLDLVGRPRPGIRLVRMRS